MPFAPPSRYRGELIRQGMLYSVTACGLLLMLVHPGVGGVLTLLALLSRRHPKLDSWVAPCVLVSLLPATMSAATAIPPRVMQLLPATLTGLAVGLALNFFTRRQEARASEGVTK